MPDFNINDPNTFNIAKSDFKGNYTYRISVNPSNPSQYTGPPFYTVSSSQLLSEDEILSQAQTIFDSRSRYQNQGLTAEFVIVEARAKPETFTGGTGAAIALRTAVQQAAQNAVDFAQNVINNILSFLGRR